jgi:hypothetical protein
VLVLLCASLALGGCSSGDEPYQNPRAAAERLATEATQRVCGILQACCVEANFAYAEQGCKAIHAQRIQQYFVAQAFYGAELDAEAAKRCLDSIGQVSDGCPVERSGGYLTDVCDGLFKGTVPLGGVCEEGHGCATTPEAPLICDRRYNPKTERLDNVGVCVANPSQVFEHTSAGQACDATCIDDADLGGCGPTDADRTCFTSDGLFCSWRSNQCEPQGVAGDPCDGSPECAPGLYCDFDDFACTPIHALGAPCTAWEQCGENYCTAGTCQRPPRVTAEYCVGKLPPLPSN